MTEKFQGWWGQRRHSFDYVVDNDYFRVWVSDDKNRDRIELNNRSRGLQWFFSFYLIFLVEAQEGHRNAILLLDEPGLSLHPTAQQELIEFFDNLASHNQLLYTTHSPFMVDGDHLERVRIVTEDDQGHTNVSDRIWPKDREATFPLQAALGYHLAQTLFQGKRNLVVEGLTDLWIIKAMDQFLKQSNRAGLNDDIVITPAGGAKEISHFASLFLANDVDVVTLFDNDPTGKRYANELAKGLFEGNDNRIVFYSASGVGANAELEDLIPRADYLKAAAVAHRDTLGGRAVIQLSADEKSIDRVIEALDTFARRKGLVPPAGMRTVFEKGPTTRHLLETWQRTPVGEIDSTMLDYFEQLFAAINRAFATPH